MAANEYPVRVERGDLIDGGKYRLDEPLGSSSLCDAWRATEVELEQTVVVHLLTAARGRSLPNFEQEAQTLTVLKHRGLVKVLDHGRADKVPYLVAEHIDAPTLADALGHDLTIDDATEALAQLLEVMDYATSRGVVHRQITPDKIYLVPRKAKRKRLRPDPRQRRGRKTGGSRLKVAEYGFAKLLDVVRDGEIDAVELQDTPYSSPEQVEGTHAVGTVTDTYAVGAIAAHLLSGDEPEPGLARTPEDAPLTFARLLQSMLGPPKKRPSARAALRILQPSTAPNFGDLSQRADDGEDEVDTPVQSRRGVVWVLLVAAVVAAALWVISANMSPEPQESSAGPATTE